MTEEKKENEDNGIVEQEEEVYRCLVVDSGPIIRLTGMSTLWKKAKEFYTVPAVMQEIRDAKARQHLDSLPFDLIPREPSREGIQAIIEFSKKTGDYQSLSSVDIQVLALLYDLEREGCGGDMSHIRTTPKRVVGLGKIEALGKNNSTTEENKTENSKEDHVEIVEEEDEESDDDDDEELIDDNDLSEKEETRPVSTSEIVKPKPTTWAALLNPNATSVVPTEDRQQQLNTLAQLTISESAKDETNGQFSDAEDDDDLVEDEQPEENDSDGIEKELQLEFPSLAAAATVPYEGSDDEDVAAANEKRDAEEEERKLRSLQPISKSGKLYNSFRKYGDLMKPKPKKKVIGEPIAKETVTKTESNVNNETTNQKGTDKNQSRIMGGMSFAGQGDDVEDDGEGWITCTKDIAKMKSAGALDPSRDPGKMDKINSTTNQPPGPPLSWRTACTTTDFAMQNVILQMNLELLSVDGIKVRKLKSWVMRCGACFKIHTDSENTGPLGKRLFCDHCGSDMMQRIAASVDGKTGRLRLHLSKKYKHNLRGTKFSLPKPGTGNRFQGDLLLREDQLMMGAWQQKVKMRSGGKAKSAAQSMFGRDIASNVGCHANSINSDDIRVGFGRRNPNAAKGRERRGKKKKGSDKACGLRRY